MPTLLFVTAPTDEILYEKGERAGKVRFPGTEKAIAQLEGKGWTVEVVTPDWPKPLRAAEEIKPQVVLVSTFKRVPASRDAASMLSRMTDVPVYTLGVLKGDEAFKTMAPGVNVLPALSGVPDPS
jgi:hypothetical protein